MIGTLLLDGNKQVTNATKSLYQPGENVREFTKRVKQDYSVGLDIQRRPFAEFNNRSLLQVISDGQKAWNMFSLPASADPDESWRWPGVRPLTRNKLISIAAHLTAQVIYPGVFAQNEDDEEDKAMAEIMRDLIEWNIRNSDYEITFLYAVISALVNPMSYLGAEWVEAMQTVKVKGKDGKYTTKNILDPLSSGFQPHVIPPEEILIADPYQYKIQEQRFIIRRRFLDHDAAKARYGTRDNFAHVTPGVKAIFNEEDGTFYDQMDNELQTLVEEVVYMNRREDVEVAFVNGIYLGKGDPESNPISHRRPTMVKGEPVLVPVYPFVKFGYEPKDEKHFYFYTSAAEKNGPDQELTDRMWRIAVDGDILDSMPPSAAFTKKKVGASVFFPGRVTHFNPGDKVEALTTGRDRNAAYGLLQELEKSSGESLASETIEGNVTKPGTTAFEISRMEQNARTRMGLFGKMIAEAVREFGGLVVDIVLTHQTVGEILETTGESVRMKFATFLLTDQMMNGAKRSKKITFSDELIGAEMTDEDMQRREDQLLKDAGGVGSDKVICMVNPAKFARNRYQCYVAPETLLPRNQRFEDALKLEGYDRMIRDPFADQQAVSRDFLYGVFSKGAPDKYMRDGAAAMMNTMLPAGAPKAPPSTPLVAQATQSESLGGTMMPS